MVKGFSVGGAMGFYGVNMELVEMLKY